MKEGLPGQKSVANRNINNTSTLKNFQENKPESRLKKLQEDQRSIENKAMPYLHGAAPHNIFPKLATIQDIERLTPSKLVKLLDAQTNKDWRNWIEPDTTKSEVETFLGFPLSDSLDNKIHAIKVVMINDFFFEHWHVFEKVCVAFNDRIPNFKYFDDLEVCEIGFAVKEAMLVRESHPDFSNEVKNYIGAKAFDEGLILLPKPLSHYQENLDKFYFNLGNERKADYIHLKLEMEELLHKNNLSELKEDAIGVGLARYIKTMFYIQSYPNLPLFAEEE